MSKNRTLGDTSFKNALGREHASPGNLDAPATKKVVNPKKGVTYDANLGALKCKAINVDWIICSLDVKGDADYELLSSFNRDIRVEESKD